MFFGDDEIKFLKGSPFLKYMEQEEQKIYRNYETIAEHVPEFKEKYNFKRYLTESMILSSRAFLIKLDGNIEPVVVPLADMMNAGLPH